MCAAALVAAGCSGTNPLLERETYAGMFKPTNLFDVSDFTRSDYVYSDVNLGPSGPVAPEDLVSADGRCVAAAAEQPQAAAEPQTQAAPRPADRPVGSFAGDLAGAPMAAVTRASAPPPDRLQPEGLAVGQALPPVMGGVALGMSECQVVRRAGAPSDVSVAADAKGERKVVLTYRDGNWPGVYRFVSGRLKVIEGVPGRARADRSKSRRKPAAARSARHGAGHVYVQ